jgi:hypothetical protein
MTTSRNRLDELEHKFNESSSCQHFLSNLCYEVNLIAEEDCGE